MCNKTTLFLMFFVIVNTLIFSQVKSHLNIEPQSKNPKPWVDRLPHSYTPLPLINDSGIVSAFENINITENSAPQNEPSVRISRKDPNRVLAAWRDFRTGVDTVKRRIGYGLSTDRGITWSPSALIPQLVPGLPYSSDPSIVVDTAGNFFVFNISLDSTYATGQLWVFKSNNEGETFDTAYSVATGPGFEDKELAACDLNMNSPYVNNLYVTWDRQISGKATVQFSKSTNDGVTWSPPIKLSKENDVVAPIPAVGPNGEVYVVWHGWNGTTEGIYFTKSTDGGNSFEPDTMISSSSAEFNFPYLAVDVSNGPNNGNIYVTWDDSTYGDEDIFISKSTDGGNGWSTPFRINDDSVGNSKRQAWPWVTVDNTGNIYIIFYDARNTINNNYLTAYLAKSIDGGLTFKNDLLSSKSFPINVPNSDVKFGDYIGIDSYNGITVPVWTDERNGGFDMEIYTAVINNLTSVESETTQPLSFLLYQNYPNPFNPTTTIKYSIPKQSIVTLKMYEILGREITTLVNEEKNAGTYKIEFNASSLASGVYFYRLKAGNYASTKKLILLK